MEPWLDYEESDKRRTAVLRAIEDGGFTTQVDGIMSPQTRSLAKKFEARGVDMTDWWAITPIAWVCAGCGRNKTQLVRLNRNGDLMCRLVEHHDHMRDLLVDKFTQISSSRTTVVADQRAEDFAKRSATMISVHENTVICNDCNNADAKAKGLVNAPRYFSFSPDEIKAFSIVVANKPHEIRQEEVIRIWEARKPIYDTRVRIAEQIAQIAATNEHWYQEGDPNSSPVMLRRRLDNLERLYGATDLIAGLCPERPSSKPKDATAWRKTSFPAAKSHPTAGEIEHIARVSHAKCWASVPDDWFCPCCQRSKARTVRQSKDGSWTVAHQSIWYRDPSGKAPGVKAILCVDCIWTAQQLGREAVVLAGRDINLYSRLVEVREIARVIVSRPHSRHLYDASEVDSVVVAIAQRIVASGEGPPAGDEDFE